MQADKARQGWTLVLALAVALAAPVQNAWGASAPATPPATASSAGPAAPAELPAPLADAVRAALKERLPDLKVLQLHATQIPGIYEVISADGITYTNESADYVLMGQLLDTKNRRNLTKEHWLAFTQVDFKSLPLSLAIKSTRGNGSRQIAVFADPNCPYCQQLEAELAKLDDVTVYTFLYPLEDVHPGATARAHQLWCAADPGAAWNNWMRKHEMPVASQCATDPIKQLAALGEKLHIQTTPTIIFRSGLRSAGLPPAQQFEQLLDKESAAATGAPVTASSRTGS
jgi:thiol:disulfide interchange protein DsbC